MFLTLDEVRAILLILETKGQVRSNNVNSLQERLLEYEKAMVLQQPQENMAAIPIAGQLSFEEVGE